MNFDFKNKRIKSPVWLCSLEDVSNWKTMFSKLQLKVRKHQFSGYFDTFLKFLVLKTKIKPENYIFKKKIWKLSSFKCFQKVVFIIKNFITKKLKTNKYCFPLFWKCVFQNKPLTFIAKQLFLIFKNNIKHVIVNFSFR